MDLQGAIELLLYAVLPAAIPVFLVISVFRARRAKRRQHLFVEIDHSALRAAEENLKAHQDQDWVVLKRCHGPGYSHTTMAEIVSSLAAEGVEATYDIIGTSSAEGGVTNFMLMVIRGQEAQALEALARIESRS
ncbi:MAG: hypothetical protein HYR96_10005 [Deltaproteobacteria bacterium]|nr:hypothetical protein [Deltaproteobacteria bacterium]MBI3296063.1 hypothetical protein [Deltaproteobacteria bacterium]